MSPDTTVEKAEAPKEGIAIPPQLVPPSGIIELSREAQEERIIVEETFEMIKEFVEEQGERLAELRADRLGLPRVTVKSCDKAANDVLNAVIAYLASERPNIWQLTQDHLDDFWSK